VIQAALRDFISNPGGESWSTILCILCLFIAALLLLHRLFMRCTGPVGPCYREAQRQAFLLQ
jgi:hypothetical protein